LVLERGEGGCEERCLSTIGRADNEPIRKSRKQRKGGRRIEQNRIWKIIKGKGRNTLTVEIEVKWGEGEKRKHMGRKRVRTAVHVQEGKISSRMALGNGMAVTAWERRIKIVAPTMALS
jgi:hypothetical protein